eukprot:57143-Pleurochrysis_carterae.AAC.2
MARSPYATKRAGAEQERRKHAIRASVERRRAWGRDGSLTETLRDKRSESHKQSWCASLAASTWSKSDACAQAVVMLRNLHRLKLLLLLTVLNMSLTVIGIVVFDNVEKGLQFEPDKGGACRTSP